MSRTLSTLLAIFLVGFCCARAAPLSPLVIAAASDLTDLEPALESSFRKSHPQIQIKWVTAASGVLTQQIQNGAPYDLFLSANAQFIDQLGSGRKVVPETIAPYAAGRLGILWRDGKPHKLQDLQADWVRFVALPNPKLAPYGAAAVEALKHEGLWPAVEKKVVYGENVRQTLQLFESGNADAVLTSDSLLQGRHPDVIPESWHAPIIQKAGIVATSSNQPAAHDFMKFLSSAAGQSVFARFGFAPNGRQPAAKPR